MFDNLLIGGRFWDGKSEDPSQLLAWVEAHSNIAKLAVAVNIANDKSHAVKALQEGGVATAIPVQPWLRWSPALLALTAEAVRQGKEYVLFLSTTMRVDEVSVGALVQIMDENPSIMHLGPAFPEHDFQPGVNKIRGRTVGWNNCSIHRVSALSGFGFQPGSEGLLDPKAQGVEEVVYDSLNQAIRGRQNHRVLLVKGLPGLIVWDVNTDSHGAWYVVYHNDKLQSKDDRPDAQLRLLGLSAGEVWHAEYGDLLQNGMPWNR
ncbi:hypothetical protein GW755_02790 [bacterium]|nr:hypothetical protein [bacterium]